MSLVWLTLDEIAVVRMHQGFVVGMPPDVAGDKRAEWDHRKVLCARLVQRRLHQLAGDAWPSSSRGTSVWMKKIVFPLRRYSATASC